MGACRRTLALIEPGIPKGNELHVWSYAGAIPCTGRERCLLCGLSREEDEQADRCSEIGWTPEEDEAFKALERRLQSAK